MSNEVYYGCWFN